MATQVDLGIDIELFDIPELPISPLWGQGLVIAATQANLLSYGGEQHVGTASPESPAKSLGGSLWRGAAYKPGEVQKIPASYSPAGEIINSIRLQDEAGRLWWLVAEHAGASIRLYLHRPITTFFFDVPEYSGDRELASIPIPNHLTDEPVSISWITTGRKLVVQIISNKTNKGTLYPDGETIRYSAPWAQLLKVVDITGIGAWPLDEAFGTWGTGINALVSDFVGSGEQSSPSMTYEVTPKKEVAEGEFTPIDVLYVEDGITYYSGTFSIRRWLASAGYSSGNYSIKGWDINIDERIRSVMCVVVENDQLTAYYVAVDKKYLRSDSLNYDASGPANGDSGTDDFFPVWSEATIVDERNISVDVQFQVSMTSDSGFSFDYEFNVAGGYGWVDGMSAGEFVNHGDKLFTVDGQDLTADVFDMSGTAGARSNFLEIRIPQIALLHRGHNHFSFLTGIFKSQDTNGTWDGSKEIYLAASSLIEHTFYAGGVEDIPLGSATPDLSPDQIYYRCDRGLVVREDQSMAVVPVSLTMDQQENYLGMLRYIFVSNQSGGFSRLMYRKREGVAPEPLDDSSVAIPWLPVGFV